MTFAWQAARIAAVLVVLGIGIALLPDASVDDSTALTIPSVVWDPIVAVLSLGRLLPIFALLRVTSWTLAIEAGLAGWWIVSWVLKHVMGS